MRVNHDSISRENFNASKRLEFSHNSMHTNQLDAEYYQYALGIDLSEMQGSSVLDIGGAPKGMFAREAQELGINLVTLNSNVDPGYTGSFEFPYGFPEDKESRSTVSALAQQLPFKKGAFDFVVSVATVPAYLPKHESEYRHTFEEMLRVLKPGGKLILFPILAELRDDPVFNELVKKLEQQSQIKFETDTGFEPPDGGPPSARMILIKNKEEHAETLENKT